MNIHTHAHNLQMMHLKKLKKQEMADLVEAIYEGKEVSKADLARLYLQVSPAPSKTPKTLEEWVHKAVLKEGASVREHLSQSYSDGENLVATDGHRLHFSPCHKPVGFYNSKGNEIEVNGIFPDYKRVIPDYNEDSLTSLDVKSLEVFKVPNSKVTVYKVREGYYLDKKYVDDALAGSDTLDIFLPETNSETCLVKSIFGFAVIMPVKM